MKKELLLKLASKDQDFRRKIVKKLAARRPQNPLGKTVERPLMVKFKISHMGVLSQNIVEVKGILFFGAGKARYSGKLEALLDRRTHQIRNITFSKGASDLHKALAQHVLYHVMVKYGPYFE